MKSPRQQQRLLLLASSHAGTGYVVRLLILGATCGVVLLDPVGRQIHDPASTELPPAHSGSLISQ